MHVCGLPLSNKETNALGTCGGTWAAVSSDVGSEDRRVDRHYTADHVGTMFSEAELVKVRRADSED